MCEVPWKNRNLQWRQVVSCLFLWRSITKGVRSLRVQKHVTRRYQRMSVSRLTFMPVARQFWASLCGKQEVQQRGSSIVSWIARYLQGLWFALARWRLVCSRHSSFWLISLPSTSHYTHTTPNVVWLKVTWRREEVYLSDMLMHTRVYKVSWPGNHKWSIMFTVPCIADLY